MDTKIKLGLGSILALLGFIGFILGPTLGATTLGRPLSFIGGFFVGVMCGIGVVLSIDGLLDRRRQR